MKTSIKLLLGLGAIVALAFTASAFDQLKGGQIQIGQTPAQARAATDTAAAPAMVGAYVKTESYTQHLCDGCKTATSVEGFGKAKATQYTHTCSSGATANCCAMK
ncbi:MAG: hypothetical protein NTZ16_08855 [Verrucomicrobia bacterium]|nr:hypothetical protein [Verrucomicrobiota bacterium]